MDPVIGIEDFKETPEIVSLDETDTTDKFFNKISTTMKRMVSRMWLCHHPQLRYVNYNNGSEFKFHFAVC